MYVSTRTYLWSACEATGTKQNFAEVCTSPTLFRMPDRLHLMIFFYINANSAENHVMFAKKLDTGQEIRSLREKQNT